MNTRGKTKVTIGNKKFVVMTYIVHIIPKVWCLAHWNVSQFMVNVKVYLYFILFFGHIAFFSNILFYCFCIVLWFMSIVVISPVVNSKLLRITDIFQCFCVILFDNSSLCWRTVEVAIEYLGVVFYSRYVMCLIQQLILQSVF